MAVATLKHEVDARMDDPPASNVPERWCDLLSGQSHFKRSMGSCLWGHLLIRVLRGDALLATARRRRAPEVAAHCKDCHSALDEYLRELAPHPRVLSDRRAFLLTKLQVATYAVDQRVGGGSELFVVTPARLHRPT